MSARSVCSGSWPCRYHYERAISAPFKRPEKIVAVGKDASEAPRPKRARALKSATTPSKKDIQKAKE